MDSTHEEVKHKKSVVGSEENGHIGYGLGENPKKSRKFSGFKEDIASSSAAAASSMEQNQCKVCGKEFESLKALYGHMRHHSGGKRRRIQCKECEKWFLSLKSLSNHMRVHAQKLRFHNDHQSETTSSSSRQDLVVESLYVKKKRSKRIKRYRSIDASCSISSLNEPLLSFNETDDVQEVEQVAVCLMMLSKGVHDWGEFHSFNEFSDDDDPAVSFEVKSLIQKRILRNDDESSEINEPRDACASDSVTDLYEQTEKNDDQLEVCTEKLHKGGEFGMPKLDIESGFVSYSIEIEKEIEVELGINFDACDSEIGVDSCNKVKFSTPESEMVDDSIEKVRIMCKNCNKMFYSHQAQGGHQKKHGVRKGCKAQKTEADCKLVKLECTENLMERKASGTAVKDHQCPICFKVFITGQALGGHKRAHFLKNTETRPQEVATSQDHPTISEDFDINIPIMIDQQDNGGVGFKQWWNDSNCKPEPLVAN